MDLEFRCHSEAFRIGKSSQMQSLSSLPSSHRFLLLHLHFSHPFAIKSASLTQQETPHTDLGSELVLLNMAAREWCNVGPSQVSTLPKSITYCHKTLDRGSGRSNTTGELEFPYELAVGSSEMTMLVFPQLEAYILSQDMQPPTVSTTLHTEMAC